MRRKKGYTKNGKKLGRPPGKPNKKPSNRKKVKQANGLLAADDQFGKLFSAALIKKLRSKAISRVVIALDTPKPKIAIYRTEITTLEVHND